MIEVDQVNLRHATVTTAMTRLTTGLAIVVGNNVLAFALVLLVVIVVPFAHAFVCGAHSYRSVTSRRSSYVAFSLQNVTGAEQREGPTQSILGSQQASQTPSRGTPPELLAVPAQSHPRQRSIAVFFGQSCSETAGGVSGVKAGHGADRLRSQLGR